MCLRAILPEGWKSWKTFIFHHLMAVHRQSKADSSGQKSPGTERHRHWKVGQKHRNDQCWGALDSAPSTVARHTALLPSTPSQKEGLAVYQSSFKDTLGNFSSYDTVLAERSTKENTLHYLSHHSCTRSHHKRSLQVLFMERGRAVSQSTTKLWWLPLISRREHEGFGL